MLTNTVRTILTTAGKSTGGRAPWVGGVGNNAIAPFSSTDATSDVKDAEDAEIVGEAEEAPKPSPHAPPPSTEAVKADSEERVVFQAETKKLLDIVAKSLYTDAEVFVRELVSNSSDALEKLRHAQVTQEATTLVDPDTEFAIWINTDDTANTITFQDSGIGMSRDDLVANLGTIARSGSKEFLQNLQNGGNAGADAASSIIGQFGVGFYSGFVVGDRMSVFSRPALDTEAPGHAWTSEGDGTYGLSEASGVHRGTKVTIHLKPEHDTFAKGDTVKRIIQKYSNFVAFPIYLNGEKINTIEPLWTKPAHTISDQEHTDFYRFLFTAWDEPMFRLSFATDSPLALRSLFYIPTSHTERLGMGRMEPGVNLYSRKVLIQPKAKQLLPDWMRFVKGVVDSEDIPLNLSRELLQDSALIRRIGTILTRRILKWLKDEAKKDAAKYTTFYHEFGNFLKEGVVSEQDSLTRDSLAPLLRFETSTRPAGTIVSLEDVASGTEGDQMPFLYAPSRELALASPYLEPYVAANQEVVILTDPRDEFVMMHVGKFQDKTLVSIESSTAKAPESQSKDKKGEDESKEAEKGSVDHHELTNWFKDTLGAGKVASVESTSKLVTSPAVIVDHDATMRRMMSWVDGSQQELGPQKLEINADHEIMRRLNDARESDPDLARTVAEQVYDNALVAAGLMSDARSMLPRVNEILLSTLKADKKKADN